jgi:hypothetical protein
VTFAIADLLGWELYARFSDLTDRRRYLLGDPDPHVPAELLLTHRANRQLIEEQYDELQRIAGSVKRGWIAPSVLISQLATDPRPDRTARALRDHGRVVETNFILRWAGEPPLRGRAHAQLSKGENANALHRALEIRASAALAGGVRPRSGSHATNVGTSRSRPLRCRHASSSCGSSASAKPASCVTMSSLATAASVRPSRAPAAN